MSKGFTLIEFMVMIVIVGILAGMVLVSIKGAKDPMTKIHNCELLNGYKYIDGKCKSDNEIKYENIGGTWFEYTYSGQCVK